jgi:DNA repair protein RecO (recombination protein O)
MTGPHDALLLTLRPHAETGAVIRALTADAGLIAAYVHGARGRRLRPVLMPGNRLHLHIATRSPGQLPTATPELKETRAPLIRHGWALATLDWTMVLAATLLPEAVPQPRIFPALDALCAALSAAAPPPLIAATLARTELLLLAELGYGLDLARCALTGATEDLAYVSPRTGRAVSRSAATPWATRLLPLPPFLLTHGTASLPEALQALALSRHFLARQISDSALLESRDRLAGRFAAMDEAAPSS